MSASIQSLPAFRHAPLFVLITAFLMLQPLSTDLYLASLPALAAHFHASPQAVQRTLSWFVLGFGLAQLLVGPLSDRFGRRPLALTGVLLYAGASLACAVAQELTLLVGARFLQAVGCCTGVVIARAIVRDAYPSASSVRLIARASSWLSLAPLLGPILGSYLQITLGWRAAFVVHTLLACTLLVLVYTRMPETCPAKNPQALHLRGLLSAYRTILGAPLFWAFALPGALSYGAIFVYISGASVTLIKVLHLPTGWFGYCFAFGVSGYLCGTVLCRRLHARLGTRTSLQIGTLLSASAGLLFLALAASGVAHWSMLLPVMFLTMGAHGINFPLSQSGAVAPFPAQAGTAAGLMGALYMGIAFLVGNGVGRVLGAPVIQLAGIAATLGLLLLLCTRILLFRVRHEVLA
jgi:DHA1 family bicyclomycin/chloramphenicol resistance-like MFS transporter